MSISHREMLRVVDDSGLPAQIDALLAASRSPRGRKRELSSRALLLGLFLVAEGGRLHLKRVPAALNALPRDLKRELGMTRNNGVTMRQVQRLYALVTAVLDKQGHDYAQDRFNDLLTPTIPVECDETTSIAIDSTDIHAFARTYNIKDPITGQVTKMTTDKDAHWRGRSEDKRWKAPFFGYDLTVAVAVKELSGPDVPVVARAIRFRPATQDPVMNGLAVAHDVWAQQGNQLGDVLVDREYTKTVDGRDFILPIRSLGGEPVFDLTPALVGSRGLVNGALMIDGSPFSPATPTKWHNVVPPPVNATNAVKLAYQAEVNKRAMFALVPHGRRDANGAHNFQCPAQVGNIKCPLVPASKAWPVGTRLAQGPATKSPSGKVCTQKFVKFDAVDMPLSQRDLFGTSEWYASYTRRNLVEGFFGSLKNNGVEGVRPGNVRMRGLVKHGLFIAVATAAANLRHVESFRARNPQAPKRVRRGRPLKTNLHRYKEQINMSGIRQEAFVKAVMAASSPPS
jgi:hypothetical protein